MIILFLGSDEIVVNVSLDENDSFLPMRLYSDSAGYDLFAGETVHAPKWSRICINTKVRLDIPKGFYGEIKSRSGLALKNGIIAFNGTIDSGYLGYVYVILFNNSDIDFDITKGNRIAQIIFKKCHSVSFKFCKQVSVISDRGVKGLGSSGV